jgi:hypothetical protein
MGIDCGTPTAAGPTACSAPAVSAVPVAGNVKAIANCTDITDHLAVSCLLAGNMKTCLRSCCK